MNKTLQRLLALLGFALLVCSRTAFAGDFTLLTEDETTVLYSYEGVVNDGDAEDLRELYLECDKDFHVIIDSPGGSAYEGVRLYWVANTYGINTIAGHKYGAYSAAALFWLGGSGDMLEGSRAGFHLAYCNPYNPPGCWTADIDAEMLKCCLDALGRERTAELFNQMNIALKSFGVNGFVMFKCIDGELTVIVEDPSRYLDVIPSTAGSL